MKAKGFIVSLMILGTTIWNYSFAQQELTLTLDKSVHLALERNPEIQKAQKEVKKSEAGVWEAWSTILPQVDASASLQRSWKIQENRIPNFIKPMLEPLAGTIPGIDQMPDYVMISFGLENTLRYGATLNQPLFLGGAGIAGIQSAKAGKQAAELNLDSKRQNLIFQAVNSFYGCLLAKETIVVQKEALDQAEANLEVVKKKYNVGIASGFDKKRAEVDVANLKPGLISAKNNYQSAITQLRTVLRLDEEKDIEILGEFEYDQDQFAQMDLDELQKLALKNRPEFLALSQQKRISKKGITIARSNFLPKLSFQTNYSFLAMRSDFEFSQDDFSEGFTSTINLQIPLFHGFRTSKQYQKAKLDHKIMLDTEQQLHDAILAETEVAYNTFNETREKFLSAKQTVDLAEEALRLANLMYEEGTNTQLDVLNSQLSLTQARMNYVRSIYEYQIARYQLRKATGMLEGTL